MHSQALSLPHEGCPCYLGSWGPKGPSSLPCQPISLGVWAPRLLYSGTSCSLYEEETRLRTVMTVQS